MQKEAVKAGRLKVKKDTCNKDSSKAKTKGNIMNELLSAEANRKFEEKKKRLGVETTSDIEELTDEAEVIMDAAESRASEHVKVRLKRSKSKIAKYGKKMAVNTAKVASYTNDIADGLLDDINDEFIIGKGIKKMASMAGNVAKKAFSAAAKATGKLLMKIAIVILPLLLPIIGFGLILLVLVNVPPISTMLSLFGPPGYEDINIGPEYNEIMNSFFMEVNEEANFPDYTVVDNDLDYDEFKKDVLCQFLAKNLEMDEMFNANDLSATNKNYLYTLTQQRLKYEVSEEGDVHIYSVDPFDFAAAASDKYKEIRELYEDRTFGIYFEEYALEIFGEELDISYNIVSTFNQLYSASAHGEEVIDCAVEGNGSVAYILSEWYKEWGLYIEPSAETLYKEFEDEGWLISKDNVLPGDIMFYQDEKEDCLMIYVYSTLTGYWYGYDSKASDNWGKRFVTTFSKDRIRGYGHMIPYH